MFNIRLFSHLFTQFYFYYLLNPIAIQSIYISFVYRKENAMHFSVVIPVFNRPEELDELLTSLTYQNNRNFEVIIVEDGSVEKSDLVVEKYRNSLPLFYYYKENTGPGLSRNAGAKKARFEYVVFFDSDCIIPENYFREVENFLQANDVDAYGGPDKALPTFTTVQKAINYSMTSFFTTGGIRGAKKSMDRFYPRSFNLGVKKKAFEAVGGYANMRFGEDIDFSLRLAENGFSTALIPGAFVFHKRRTNFKKFFKQVYNSGIARVNLYLEHPRSLKIVHLLPSLFVFVMLVLFLSAFICPYALLVHFFYSIFVFTDSAVKNKSITVGLYSIVAAWTQLFAYGTGFLWATWNRIFLKKGQFIAFGKKFYD